MLYKTSGLQDIFHSFTDKMRSPQPEITVAMVGPRGAGKTSVLTAMYERFDSVVGGINLALRPDDANVTAMLNDRMTQLLHLVKDPEHEAGIQGDAIDHIYKFAIGRRGSSKADTSFTVAFHDCPGGWLAGYNDVDNESVSNYAQVVDIVRKSDVAQIAIDTPYLMEDDGKYHEKRNMPGAVAELFRSSYAGRDSKKLVIFSPIKCEAYVGTPEGRADLLKRIHEGYAEAFDVLKGNSSRSKLLVAVTPVQTTGCVCFKEWVRAKKKDYPESACYHIAAGQSVYQPKDSDQPLSYIILFAMRQYKEEVASNRIRSFLSEMFRLDNHIKEGFDHLASTCKSSDGFELIDMTGKD